MGYRAGWVKWRMTEATATRIEKEAQYNQLKSLQGTPAVDSFPAVIASDYIQKLKSDIELAARYQIDGTPLVLVNGRKATSFPPFLYAMVLTGGRTDHPAFATLPAANPSALLP